MTEHRQKLAFRIRLAAAELARSRPVPNHRANGDEQRWSGARYAMSFTKGLEHDPITGLLARHEDFEAFRKAIDEGYVDAFTRDVAVPQSIQDERREWEAPTAGVVSDLQGPDAQMVTMPPAPALGSDELAYEMAEVYELALLRDTPLTALQDGVGDPQVGSAISRLNSYAYRPASGRGRPRKTDSAGDVTEQTVFRGSSVGVEVGPYLSQFMLMGNGDQTGVDSVSDGKIRYGALQISQKVALATPNQDYMQTKARWLHVQNGFKPQTPVNEFQPRRRFISTPRDLATYVHFDALYEAYLNACVILLGMGTPFDPAFQSLSGNSKLLTPTGAQLFVKRNAGGFALYGGPHILTLVTEVATRALKAVRFQKFNTHIRIRPEALAGRIACLTEINTAHPILGAALSALRSGIASTVSAIEAFNGGMAFLPMAFPEGSPMHPSYGAGHAAVAGACVTILKAYFDTDTVLTDVGGVPAFRRVDKGGTPVAYTPNNDGEGGNPLGTVLIDRAPSTALTLEGELNKLAANIAIGRNMAGVHYFTDYYDSLRMGEQVALSVLEEQALCYPTDPFVLSVPTFDGPVVRIGRR